MGREGNELYDIEAKVEHTAAKAWLIEETVTGKQVWLPKSIAIMSEDTDGEGNHIFKVPKWWLDKNELI